MGKQRTRIDEILSTQSCYCYDDSDILVNKLSTQDYTTLENVERTLTTYNLSKLHLDPIKGNFDIEHYLAIHKFLFDYIYDFAGELRLENMCKDNTPFCRPEYIHKYLKYLLLEMGNKSKNIKSEEHLIEFLAYYYSEINMVHPFREGNGRTEREFFREYVLELNKKIKFGNYELDYSLLDELDRKQMILGSIISACNGELDILKSVFEKVLVNTKEIKETKKR